MPGVATVSIGPHVVGGRGLVFLLGPCVLEGEAVARRIGNGIAEVCDRLAVPWIFKASFDKANRSSRGSFRGPGLDAGLEMLQRLKAELGVPVTTDVHLPDQAAAVAQVADLLQVPALLCRQTDLLDACAATGRPVNVKKGQFMAPGDMEQVLGKLVPGRSFLTERGTTFGYRDLVVDYRSLPRMRSLGVPVCFDCTHSVQSPGGPVSGGDREMIAPLARAAAAVGIDALFAEVHDRPEEALSDGPSMVRLSDLATLLTQVRTVHDAARAAAAPEG